MINYTNDTTEDEYLTAEELKYPVEEQQILRALRYLKDRGGFSRMDKDFGSEMAVRGKPWTAKQLLAGFKVARKYQRTQLAPAGILLPEEEAVQTLAKSKEMRYVAYQQGRGAEDVRSNSKFRLIGIKDGNLGITFPTYAQDFESNLKKIRQLQREVRGLRLLRPDYCEVELVEAPGKATGEPIKYWQAPMDLIEQVCRLFPDLQRTPDVQCILDEKLRKAREEHERAQAAFRAHQERTDRLLAAIEDLNAPVGDRTLYQHQKDAIYQMIDWGSGIIAYDQGLGKTLIGCMIGKAYKEGEGCRVIVAGPKTMRGAWIEEAGHVECPIEYYSHDSIPEDVPGKYILIVDECDSYQNMRAVRTKKFIELSMKAMAVFPMSGTPARNGRPSGVYPALLAVKNPAVYAELSDGTPAEDTVKALRKKYEARYCAATPTEHSAWDTTGAAFLEEFHRKFVGTPRGILRKLIDDCIDLPEKVRNLVPVELNEEEERAFRAEVAKMWEDHKARVAEKLEEFKVERLPAMLEEEIKRWLRHRFDKKRIDHVEELLAQVPDEEIEEVKARATATLLEEERDRLAQGDALVSMGQYRHAGSRAKARAVIDATWKIFEEDAEEALEAEREGREHKPAAVVIFCEFKDVAQRIAGTFDVPVLSGDTPDKKRDPIIEAFQNGERRVFVGIYGAAGSGLTLHAAAHIFLVGRPMTPGAAFQAEARIRRIGQTRTCLCIWPQIPASINPVDGRIDEMLQIKQKNIATMLDGATEENKKNVLEFTQKEALDLFYEATHFTANKEESEVAE